MTSAQLRQFALQHPTLLAALTGGAVGGAVGGAASDEGQRGKGILGGAAVGAGAGALAGHAGDKVRRVLEAITPSPQKALIAGGVVGGAVGGYHGRSMLPPWVKQRLMTESDLEGKSTADNNANLIREINANKEAAVSTPANTPTEEARAAIEKSAEFEKTAAERNAAFCFGMESYCNEHEIDAEAFAKEATAALGGTDPNELIPRTIAWLNQEAEAPVA